MLSSHRFLCLPLHLPPWTVPCRIVLASPDDRMTCPHHFSLHLFIEVRRSPYGPMVFPILAFISSLVMWVSVSVSAQDGILALGKAHMRSAPSLSSLPKVALETVPIFAWLKTDRSGPGRMECQPLPFSLVMWSVCRIPRSLQKHHISSSILQWTPDVVKSLGTKNSFHYIRIITTSLLRL